MATPTDSGDRLVEVSLPAKQWATILRVMGNAMGAGPVEVETSELESAGSHLMLELKWKL